MTREEAKEVFLSRGYIEVEGGTIYDADKWRESCRIISKWLEQESCDSCKHDSESWDSDACDGCCKAHSRYEPKEQFEDCGGRRLVAVSKQGS